MASRRVLVIVALCAAVAVAAIVGGTVLMSRNERTSDTVQGGRPPVQLELGFRRDAKSLALEQAQLLLDRDGNTAAAAAIFRRYDSVEAQLGLAFASWSGRSSLGAVRRIAKANPDNPAVLLNLGWAQYWAGAQPQAIASWQQTEREFPNSAYAVDAEDALHSDVAPGLPPIVVDIAAVPANARADLAAGVRQWNLKHVGSARQALRAAAKLAPHSPETLVAAAVARFSPAAPLAPFPLLGPLTAEFPQDSVVRLHLGVLLLWSRQVARGKAQLREASAEQPGSIYAEQARKVLKALAGS